MLSDFVCVCLSVCVSVCPRAFSGIAGPIVTKFVVQIPCGRGSILRLRCCDTLCSYGFMDDVTFGRNGPCGDGSSGIPGRSLMSMNVLLVFVFCTLFLVFVLVVYG